MIEDSWCAHCYLLLRWDHESLRWLHGVDRSRFCRDRFVEGHPTTVAKPGGRAPRG